MNQSSEAAQKGGVKATQLLQLLGNKVTGRLTVYASGVDVVPWRIYLSNGNIHYVTSTLGQRERLTYFLQRHYPQLAIPDAQTFKTEYDFLCDIWRSGRLTFQELRGLVQEISQEALLQALKSPQVDLSFDKGLDLDPILLSAPAQHLLSPVKHKLQQWATLFANGISPFYRVRILKSVEFRDLLTHQSLQDRAYQNLESLLASPRCLYELATDLQVDLLDLCSFLLPLMEKGVISTAPYRNQQNRPLIACIDDSKTVQRNVRLILEAAGYQALELTDPTRALTTLVRNKPALILMDISMPGIDGYELCRMLRATGLLKTIPIIMLTGRDGVVDRLRARMVGANDYLTKPCEANQLLEMIQKLLTVETAV